MRRTALTVALWAISITSILAGGKGSKYIIGEEITTVGLEDNSSAFFTSFSSYYQIPAEGILTLRFINHTDGEHNWNNWVLCVATDADRDTENYNEYFLLRADNYGWGPSYDHHNIVSNFDWEKYQAEMEGCEMLITIVRTGSKINVTADYKCLSGTTYYEAFTAECGDGSQTVRAFLSTELGHLENISSNLRK